MKTPVFILSLAAGFTPVLLQAQQLQQPDSVLPWKPRAVQLRIAQAGPVTPPAKVSPNWLMESIQELPRPASRVAELPMVEAEGFVDLGEIEVSNKSPQRTSVRQGSSDQGQKFDIFRSLGFRSTRQQ